VHELSIAQELMRLCEQRLAEGHSLGIVRIAVGELAAVEPLLLQFAWQAVTAGTPHDAARLDIIWHPAKQHCGGCGEVAERQAGTWLRLCPICRQPLQVVGGDELDLIEVGTVPTSLLALAVASLEEPS